MLERLGGGTVGDPVLLELVQMLGTLEYHDDRRQTTGHPDRTVYRGHHRQHRRHRDFQELEPLVEALILAALAGVPADLTLQPVPGRILGGHNLDRPRRFRPVSANCHRLSSRPTTLISQPDSTVAQPRTGGG